MQGIVDRRILGLNAVSIFEAPALACSELDNIDALVAAYWSRVLRFVAFSVNDEDLAKTITQDCFLKAFENRASFRGESTVSTWIFSIANNLIRSHMRRKKIQFWRTADRSSLDVTDMAGMLSSDETSVERRLIASERMLLVKAALDDLSVNQRRVFLLKYFEDMDIDEISEQLVMPENTVKTHLHRATTAIRTRMGEKR